MNIVTCSAKHSPGATTLALALTCALADDHADDPPPVLVELDPAGGDLAARLGLPLEPGLASLAAALRHGTDASILWRHAHALPAGGAVVVAPTDPAECGAAIRSLGVRLATTLAVEARHTVIDAGRTSDATRLVGVFGGALVVVACRPDLAGIEHTRRLVAGLRALDEPGAIAIVTIGDRPYGPADVTAAADGVPAVRVDVDPAGAAALVTGPARRARRSSLVRTARALLDLASTGARA